MYYCAAIVIEQIIKLRLHNLIGGIAIQELNCLVKYGISIIYLHNLKKDLEIELLDSEL